MPAEPVHHLVTALPNLISPFYPSPLASCDQEKDAARRDYETRKGRRDEDGLGVLQELFGLNGAAIFHGRLPLSKVQPPEHCLPVLYDTDDAFVPFRTHSAERIVKQKSGDFRRAWSGGTFESRDDRGVGKDSSLGEEEGRNEAYDDSEGKHASLSEAPRQTELQDIMKGKWEGFLPQRPLKILLVEDDNATRHVVSVLLQKCNYEVTTAANGLEAWEIMESTVHQFDLVLTDVIMPVLSGIGLLTKIMRNESHRDTPVIMMSSNDSLDIVFKCLLRGAKDFLVKPLRKNELRNLWQHVWRKCLRSLWMKRLRGLESPLGNSYKVLCNPACAGLASIEDWNTESEVACEQGAPLHEDVDSSQHASHGISNAQEHGEQIYREVAFTNSNSSVPSHRTGKVIDLIGTIAYHSIHGHPEREDGLEGELALKSAGSIKPKGLRTSGVDASSIPMLELTLKRPYSIEDQGFQEDGRGNLRWSSNSAFSRYNGHGVPNSMNGPSSSDQCSLSGGFGGHSTCTGDGVGNAIDVSTNRAMHCDRGHCNGSNGSLRVSISQTNAFHPGVVRANSSFSFVTSEGDKDGLQSVQDATFLGLASPAPNRPSSVAFSPRNIHFHGKGHMGGHSTEMHPTYLSCQVASSLTAKQSYTSDLEVYDHSDYVHHHHEFHCPHHHYYAESSRAGAVLPNQDQEIISEARIGARPCTSSENADILPSEKLVEKEGDIGNTMNVGNAVSSLNLSASGSNEGSTEGTLIHHSNTPRNTPSAASGGSFEDGPCTEGNSIVLRDVKASVVALPDQVRNAQREAALDKFRRKRKVRCFEKKVRYQSRKKLAEQRPRVKGQFVRQVVYEAIIQEKESRVDL